MASPSPLPLMRVEKWGSKILGNTSSAMPVPSSVTAIRTAGVPSSSRSSHTLAFTSARLRESCILEQVEQHFAELVATRHREDGLVLHVAAPRHGSFAEPLQCHHVAHDLADVRRLGRRVPPAHRHTG